MKACILSADLYTVLEGPTEATFALYTVRPDFCAALPRWLRVVGKKHAYACQRIVILFSRDSLLSTAFIRSHACIHWFQLVSTSSVMSIMACRPPSISSSLESIAGVR